MVRTQAIFGGDFTPIHKACVAFSAIWMPDGRRIRIHTLDSIGLGTIAVPGGNATKKKDKKTTAKTTPPNDPGVLGTVRQQSTRSDQQPDQCEDQRAGGHGPRPEQDKAAEDFLLKKLPYHPQWYFARNPLPGSIVARGPRSIGSALGCYGLACSFYSNE